MHSLIPLSLLLTVFDLSVHAFVFPFNVHIGGVNPTTSLKRRTPATIRNIGNAQYVSNITLAGQQLQVLLDTGSSDLWVHFPGTVPDSSLNNTGKTTSLSYAVGTAGGPILTGQATMGGATVPNQAFMLVNDTSTFSGSSSSSLGYDGLLGLGPNSGSVVHKKIGNSAGDTFLQRVFEANTTSENYITVLLNRSKDPGQNLTGQFTITETASGFENITNMPKLDVDKVNKLLKADQHWQALTDKDQGIIGPDGVAIQMSSIVPNAPDGQYVAVIDSGFTFSQVPRDMSDAIYGRVQGAYYDETDQWWLVPCGQYLNVSFNFGGVNYPMHPLDLVDDNFLQTDATGKKVCIGSFQPITSAFSILGHYDMILGMNFLRSAYALLNFGNWITGSTTQDTPFMQLLSIVDPVAARKDFINVRLGGNDTISDSKWAILPANQTVHSPVSAEEKKKKYQEMVLSRWPYIFVGCLAFVILTTGYFVWRCCRRRKARAAKGMGTAGTGTGTTNFNPFKKTKRESYVPLAAQRSVADLSAPYAQAYPEQQQQQQQHDYSSSTYPTPQYPSEQGYRNSQQSYHSQHSYHSQQGYPGQQPYPNQQGYYSQHQV